ncbi:MAG: hypothetical protein QOJ79_3307 [Actinomycetota bacterium]|jgi:hypothetical protein|nr:hypothetical protein [Actinomycetota bacterium]
MTAPRVVTWLVCLAASVQMFSAAAAVAAEPKPVAGYWWIAEPDAGGVPPPSSVPAGGLYVGSSAAGATAVSAVGFLLPAGTTATRLTLKVASSNQVDGVAVDAYPLTGTWKGGDAQPWSGRPTYDAKATPVHGSLQSGGTTLVFNLAPSPFGAGLAFILVPAAGSPASPTFDLSLEPPTTDSLTTTPSAAAPPPTSSSSTSGFEPQASPPALALAGPLPALGSVGIVQDPPKIAPQSPLAVAPLPATAPVARRVVSGRSRRDLALLVFLLADAMFYLGWLSRDARSAGGGERLSIYDLPPAPATAEA